MALTATTSSQPPRHLRKAPPANVTPVGKLDTEINYVRREVVGQLARQAAEVGADAVIGIRQLPGVINWDDGTAIAPGKDGPKPPDPRVAVSLVDLGLH